MTGRTLAPLVAPRGSDIRGRLGLDSALPDLEDVELEITISSPASERDVRSVVPE